MTCERKEREGRFLVFAPSSCLESRIERTSQGGVGMSDRENTDFGKPQDFDDFKSSLHTAMTMRALSQALP